MCYDQTRVKAFKEKNMKLNKKILSCICFALLTVCLAFAVAMNCPYGHELANAINCAAAHMGNSIHAIEDCKSLK